MRYRREQSSSTGAPTILNRSLPPSRRASHFGRPSDLGACVLRLRLPPGLPVLEDALRFITAYVKRRYVQRVAEQVGLAAYELLGNALDYGRVGHDVTLELRASAIDITVLVGNEAINERIDMLARHLDRLRNDAAATYEQEMTKSLTGHGARAMLGLARVSHEAGMELGFAADGSRVQMTATCRR